MNFSQQQRNLFLLDDDEDDLDFFCEAVNILDASIMCTRSTRSDQALSLFQRKEIAPPAMLFLDLNMPVIPGSVFLSEFRHLPAYANVPVIVYSTSSSDVDKSMMLKLGASGFITKPCRQDELISALRPLISSLGMGLNGTPMAGMMSRSLHDQHGLE